MDGWMDGGWMEGWMKGWMKNETILHEKPKEGRIREKGTGTERKKTKQNSIFINLNHNIMYLSQDYFHKVP